jgi:hypothetical protein
LGLFRVCIGSLAGSTIEHMFACDVTELDAAETLTAATDAHAVRTQADLDLIDLSLHFADLHPDPATIPGHVSLPGGERGWVCGGPGCPGFAEFAAAEFGAAIGRSTASAAAFMGQSLALRHRLPLTLAMIRSGHGEPWKARTIATACLPLSVEAAAIVDRRVARIIDTVTPTQLDNIVKAAIQQADPDRARATAEQNTKERGVHAGRTDEHGTTTLHIRAATGDVIRLKTTLRQIADALAELGDTDTLRHRTAKAVGIISDPALTHELLTIAHHLTKTAPTTGTATTADQAPTSQTAARKPTTDQTAADEAAPDEWPMDEWAMDEPAKTDQTAADEATAADLATGGTTATDDATTGNAAAVDAAAEPAAAMDRAAAMDAATAAGTDQAATDSSISAGTMASTTQTDATVAPAPTTTPMADATQFDPTGNWYPADEPGLDDEADRDPPHPSDPTYDIQPDSAPPRRSGPPGPLGPSGSPEATGAEARPDSSAVGHRGTHHTDPAEPADAAGQADPGMDAGARRELARKLAAIRQAAYSTGIGSTGRRPASTTVYVHITDQTLLAGEGVTRVERFGPVFTARLEELLGHGQIIIKPVIDLNDDKFSVNAYEIPRRIRERVKLTHPVEQFPYGSAETTDSTDLDHIQPYDFQATGPPGQTSITNLAPLRRYSHRVKTHGGWKVRRLDNGSLEWTTKHGLKFLIDHNGTHPLTNQDQ